MPACSPPPTSPFAPIPATAIVLAGGKSRRMGHPKALLGAPGETLLERTIRLVRPHVAEVLVSGNPRQVGFAGVPVVADRVGGQGPLMAVASTLAMARYDTAIVVTVDMPDLPAALLRRLLSEASSSSDVVVPRANGLYEPLFAVYRRSALPAMEGLLARGGRRILDLYPLVRTRTVEIPHGLPNLNTPGDWEAWRAREG